jgi:cobalt-zinc-cadmium efflux system membrane fusion protein
VEGVIDEIGFLIDPNQHTAVVKGHIDNKDHLLLAGQFITAKIVLPRPVAEVVLPSSALVEDDHQTFIFIQVDAKKFAYEQRRVLVVRRGKDAVHVRTRLTPEQERQGFQTVRPGEHVVTAGVLELKAILDDLKVAKDR